jgi:hypothetical protein
MYRELAPLVVEDRRDPTGCRNRQAVLDACECVVRRLAYERHFARPDRWLFREVRPHFRVGDQLQVWRVVKGHVGLAIEFRSRFPSLATVDGPPPRCGAFTRAGEPCQRTPLPGRDYCPSHKHLEEIEEIEEIAA